jgi:hypothetical protein
VVLLPVSTWQGLRFHDDVVFHKETPAIVAALRKDLPSQAIIMARAYTPASLLSYHAGEYWPVFGIGKFHARQDDVIVDFRHYAGRPVRIFDRKPIDPAAFAPFFDAVKIGSFEVAGIRFWYADGSNFNYAAYREQVLKTIAQRYYRIPGFLPIYGCHFLERYDLAQSVGISIKR